MVLIGTDLYCVGHRSIGDLTATNRLSGHRHGDESWCAYWRWVNGRLAQFRISERSRHLSQHRVQSE